MTTDFILDFFSVTFRLYSLSLDILVKKHSFKNEFHCKVESKPSVSPLILSMYGLQRRLAKKSGGGESPASDRRDANTKMLITPIAVARAL